MRLQRINSNDVPAPERVEYLNHHKNTMNNTARRTYPRPLQLVGMHAGTSRYRIAQWRQTDGPYELTRTSGDIRRDPGDQWYTLGIQTRGVMHVESGRDKASLVPGMAVLMGQDITCSIHAEPDHGLTFSMPREQIDQALGTSGLVVPLSTQSGMGRLAAAMALALPAAAEGLAPQAFDEMGDRLAEIICMAVLGDQRPEAPVSAPRAAEAIRAFVAQHVGPGELLPKHAEMALGWSERSIRRTLAATGLTWPAVVREERLRKARHLLLTGSTPMAVIAQECGYPSEMAFSEAYYEMFRQTPTQDRANALLRHHRQPDSGV